MINIRQGIKKLLGIHGLSHSAENTSDFTSEEIALIKKVSPFTMTGPARCVSLMRAIDYLLEHDIKGDFVECGVWKGGSVMIMAEKLMAASHTDRPIFLFDTFEGMSAPTDHDKSFDGLGADVQLAKADIHDQHSVWCYSTLDEVKQNVYSTGYPPDMLHFIQGKVEDTVPGNAPEQIALLRLDTDWYESTKHELIHLFPRLAPGGILIIDDYGHWEGCKKATDEYFAENNIKIFLSRIDYTGRIGVKLNA